MGTPGVGGVRCPWPFSVALAQLVLLDSVARKKLQSAQAPRTLASTMANAFPAIRVTHLTSHAAAAMAGKDTFASLPKVVAM